MIISGIILIAYQILSWLIALFPTSTGFPTDAHTAMQTLGGYLGIWSPILPITTLGTVVGFVLAGEVGIFTFKGIKWIISHIPWAGGKGN